MTLAQLTRAGFAEEDAAMVKRISSLALCAVLAVGLLGACGGDEAGSGSVTMETSPTTQPPATTQAPTTSAAPAATTSAAPATTTTADGGETDDNDAGTATVAGGEDPVDHLAPISDRGVIRVGAANDWGVPFLRLRNDGTFDGFEPALVRELVARMFGDLEIEFFEIPWRDEREMVEQGLIDLVIGKWNTNGDYGYGFTSPHLLEGPALLVLANGGVESIDDLAGLRVGIETDSRANEWLLEMMAAAQLPYEPVVDDSLSNLADLLAAGDIVAMGADWTDAVRIAAGDSDLIVMLADFADSADIAIGVPAGRGLRREINATLDEIISDGTWLELYLEWFGADPPFPVAMLLG